MSNKKLILVIGATGAQGIAVIDALLAPSKDGNPSPYSVRALTRDPKSQRARELTAKGVECVKGSFEDFPAVLAALKGVYGVWANTDGFTVGEAREIYAGMRIFELAKQIKTVRHYIWSSLDYVTKVANYDPKYQCDHYDAKGRVQEWLERQETFTNEDGMSWSTVTTAAYMEMLNFPMFGPIKRRSDGTHIFVSPVGNGSVPMIALADLGFWARFSFDNRAQVSGKELKVISQYVKWEGPDGLVETFKRITGQKAVYVPQTIKEWMNNFTTTDIPVAADTSEGTTWRKNFTGWWNLFRDDIIVRDIEWIRSIHPQSFTLESWMKENNYAGKSDSGVLKATADRGYFHGLNEEAVSKL